MNILRWRSNLLLLLVGLSAGFRSAAACASPSSGLVGFWRAEGNTTDATEGNIGTLSGHTVYSTGLVGQAFSFDGIDSSVELGSSDAFHLQNLTIEAWVRRADAQRPSQVWFGAILAGGVNNFGLALLSDGKLTFSKIGVDRVDSVGAITDTAWHHIAVTKGGTDVTFYIDGKPAGASTYTSSFSFETPLAIGSLTQNLPVVRTEPFWGLIDELSLYNRALSAAEVGSIYSAGPVGKCVAPPENIKLTATAPAIARPGEDFTVTFTLENDGTHPATGVVLSTPMPTGFTLVTNTTSQGTSVGVGGAFLTVLGTLPGGGNAVVTLTGHSIAPASLVFHGQATRDGTDASLGDNQADAGIEVLGLCVPAPSGLVAWLRAEGTTMDEYSHTSTGSGVRYAPGKAGQAFEFDGSNQVWLKDSPELDGDSFTIETWVFPTSLDGAVNIIANKESGSQFYEFQYEVGIRGRVIDLPGTIPVGNVAFYLGGVTGLPDDYGGWIDGLAQAPVGRWTHVALAVSPGTATVYVDGEATRRLTGLGGSLRKTNGPLKIGARDDSFGARDRFKGRIDEFSFYGRALTGDEIAAVFQAGAAGKCVQPVQPSPVAIVAQPASKTVLWGTEATFSVAATGTAPLTYQWRFKGADIPGATGPQLFVGAVGKVSAGDYSVTVCNPVGCVTSAPATLTVTPGPAIIRAINSTTKAPEILSVPIVLEANGVENALSFTLRFDPEQLDYQGASRSGAGTAQLLVNDSRADEGLLGVVLALPAGGKFPEGVQEVLRLNFRPEPSLADSTRALRFTDELTLRQLADADAKSLGSGWVDGYARVIAADYEGDVSPAPGGDKQLTVTDWVLIGRYVAGLEGVPTGTAFQRADCAPLSASGNGRLTVADWVQAGRFAVGLDPVRSAGGPLNPTTPPVPPTRGGPLPQALENRAVSLSERTSRSGEAKEIVVQLAATGNENALAFSVSYDPAALRFLGASIGADATQAMLQMNMQQAAEGRVGLALALTAGANFSAGKLEVAKLRFAAVAGPADSAELSFTDAPVFREIAAPSAETLPSAWVGTSVGVVPATLAVSRTQTPDGPAIVLAWPAALAGARLETTDGPDTAWEPVAVAPVVNDGRNTVTLPLSHAAGWYRLKLP